MKGMLDKATTEYERALEINPNHAMAHNNLGCIYLMKGVLDKATTEYERALEINPNYAVAHNNLAIAHYNRGEYSLAIIQCDRAVELGHRVHTEFLKDLEPYREGRADS